jgi:hypothetical protein
MITVVFFLISAYGLLIAIGEIEIVLADASVITVQERVWVAYSLSFGENLIVESVSHKDQMVVQNGSK